MASWSGWGGQQPSPDRVREQLAALEEQKRAEEEARRAAALRYDPLSSARMSLPQPEVEPVRYDPLSSARMSLPEQITGRMAQVRSVSQRPGPERLAEVADTRPRPQIDLGPPIEMWQPEVDTSTAEISSTRPDPGTKRLGPLEQTEPGFGQGQILRPVDRAVSAATPLVNALTRGISSFEIPTMDVGGPLSSAPEQIASGFSPLGVAAGEAIAASPGVQRAARGTVDTALVPYNATVSAMGVTLGPLFKSLDEWLATDPMNFSDPQMVEIRNAMEDRIRAEAEGQGILPNLLAEGSIILNKWQPGARTLASRPIGTLFGNPEEARQLEYLPYIPTVFDAARWAAEQLGMDAERTPSLGDIVAPILGGLNRNFNPINIRTGRGQRIETDRPEGFDPYLDNLFSYAPLEFMGETIHIPYPTLLNPDAWRDAMNYASDNFAVKMTIRDWLADMPEGPDKERMLLVNYFNAQDATNYSEAYFDLKNAVENDLPIDIPSLVNQYDLPGPSFGVDAFLDPMNLLDAPAGALAKAGRTALVSSRVGKFGGKYIDEGLELSSMMVRNADAGIDAAKYLPKLSASVKDFFGSEGMIERFGNAAEVLKNATGVLKRSPSSQAELDTNSLFQYFTHLIPNGVTLKSDMRAIINAVVDNPQVLYEQGVDLLSPGVSSALRDGAGNIRWMPSVATVGNKKFTKLFPALQFAGEKLKSLESLAGDGNYNPFEVWSELLTVLHKASRRVQGLDGGMSVPLGTTKARVGGGNGKFFVEYLTGTGKKEQVIKTGPTMSMTAARREAERVNSSIRTGGINVMTIPDLAVKAQKDFLNFVWLGARPMNWITNAMSAAIMTYGNDALTVTGNSDLLDYLARKGGGNLRTLAVGTGIEVGQTVSPVARQSTTLPGKVGEAIKKGNEWVLSIPYGATEISLPGGAKIPFGEQAFYLRNYGVTYERGFNSVWDERTLNQLLPQLVRAGMPPEMAARYVDEIYHTGVVGNEMEVLERAQTLLDADVVPVGLSQKGIDLTDGTLSATAARNLNTIPQRFTPGQLADAAREVRSTFMREKNRLSAIVGANGPMLAPRRWTQEELLETSVLAVESVQSAGRKAAAGLDPAAAKAIADETKAAALEITGVFERERAGWESVRNELLGGGDPDPDALNAVADFQAKVLEARAKARKSVDKAQRNAGAMQRSGDKAAARKMWLQARAVELAAWRRYGEEFSDLVAQYRELMANIRSGKPYTVRSWDSVLSDYLNIDEARIARDRQIVPGVTTGTTSAEVEGAYDATKTALRDAINAKFVEIVDTFRMFPTEENFDLLIHMNRLADEWGAAVAASLDSSKVTGDAKRLLAREEWNNYIDDVSAAADEMREVMVSLGISRATKSGLTWDVAGDSMRLIRPSGDGKWIVWSTAAKRPAELAESAIPPSVMDEWTALRNEGPAAYNRAMEMLKAKRTGPSAPQPAPLFDSRKKLERKKYEDLRKLYDQTLLKAGVDQATLDGIKRKKDYLDLIERVGAPRPVQPGPVPATVATAQGAPVPARIWSGDAWRVDTGYRHARGSTALDVVNYEQVDLGNDIKFDPSLTLELSSRPADDLVWVTKTKKDASRYGSPQKYAVPNGSIIVGEDGDGGYLILRGGLSSKPAVPTPAYPPSALPSGVQNLAASSVAPKGVTAAQGQAAVAAAAQPVINRTWTQGGVTAAVKAVGGQGMPPPNDIASAMLARVNALEQKYLANLPEILAGAPGGLTPAIRQQAMDSIRKFVTNEFARATEFADEMAQQMANHAMLNFGDRTVLEEFFAYLIPYSYYWAHMPNRVVALALQKPGFVNFAYELQRAAQEDERREREASDLVYPARLGGTNLLFAEGGVQYRMNAAQMFDRVIPGKMYMRPNPYEDPEEATNDWERYMRQVRQWTPGLYPIYNMVINEYLDRVSPLPNGDRRNQEFDWADNAPQLRAILQWAAGSPASPVSGGDWWLTEDFWNPYRARRAISTILQERYGATGMPAGMEDIGLSAQQMATNVYLARKTGKDVPIESGIEPQYIEPARALLKEAIMRAANERMTQSGSSLMGFPIQEFPVAEGQLYADQQEFFARGYDPATGEGSKAEAGQMFEESPALGVFTARTTDLAEDATGGREPALLEGLGFTTESVRQSQAQQVRNNLYFREIEEIGVRENAARDAEITRMRQEEGRDPTEAELQPIIQPFFDERDAAKARYKYEPRPPSRRGMNPREQAEANLQQILRQKYPNKPEYPIQGVDDDEERKRQFDSLPLEERKEYYANLAEWEMNQNRHIDTLLRMQSDFTAKWYDPAVASEFRKMVSGQYASDLLRRYENRFMSDLGYDWAEREAIRTEHKDAEWAQRENNVRRAMGNEAVAMFDEYSDRGADKEALKESDWRYSASQIAAYNPDEYQVAVKMWGPEWYKIVHGAPKSPSTWNEVTGKWNNDSTPEEQDAYLAALSDYRIANPQYEQIRLWLNGRNNVGERGLVYKNPDGSTYKEKDFGEDYAEILSYWPDTFKNENTWDLAWKRYNDSVGNDKNGHDPAQGPWNTVPNWDEVERNHYAYKKWKDEFAAENKVLPAPAPQPVSLTGERPIGSGMQPILPEMEGAVPPSFVRMTPEQQAMWGRQAAVPPGEVVPTVPARPLEKLTPGQKAQQSGVMDMMEYALRDEKYADSVKQGQEYLERRAVWAQAEKMWPGIEEIVKGYNPSWSDSQKSAYYDKYPQILEYWDWKYGDDGRGGGGTRGGGSTAALWVQAEEMWPGIRKIVDGYDPDWSQSQKQAYYAKFPQILEYWNWRYGERARSSGGGGFYYGGGGGGGGGFSFGGGDGYGENDERMNNEIRINPRYFDPGAMLSYRDVRRWSPTGAEGQPDWLGAGRQLSYSPWGRWGGFGG